MHMPDDNTGPGLLIPDRRFPRLRRRAFWVPDQCCTSHTSSPRWHGQGHERHRSVMARLGHASIQMTADTYGDLFPRGDDGAELAAAEKAFLGWSLASSPPRPSPKITWRAAPPVPRSLGLPPSPSPAPPPPRARAERDASLPSRATREHDRPPGPEHTVDGACMSDAKPSASPYRSANRLLKVS